MMKRRILFLFLLLIIFVVSCSEEDSKQQMQGQQQGTQEDQSLCGDGTCDEAEQQNADLCPEDCEATEKQVEASEETTEELERGECTQTTQMFQPGGDDVNWSTLDIYIATSDDGKTFDTPEVFMQGSGVNSLTTGSDGTIIAVFQWFPEDNPEYYNKVGMRKSTDNGKMWSDPQIICLEDYPTNLQAPYDPTITVTEDGEYRIYFTTHELGDTSFYYGSMISDDGLHYTYEEGARFAPENSVVDSAVVRVEDIWYMVAPLAKQAGKALDAVSSDGLTFTETTSNRDQARSWVGNMVNVDGTIRFYGGSWYSETTDGETWSTPTSINLAGVGDPAVTVTQDGTYILIYPEPKTD